MNFESKGFLKESGLIGAALFCIWQATQAPTYEQKVMWLVSAIILVLIKYGNKWFGPEKVRNEQRN